MSVQSRRGSDVGTVENELNQILQLMTAGHRHCKKYSPSVLSCSDKKQMEVVNSAAMAG